MISLLIRKVILPAALSFAIVTCFAQNVEGEKSLSAPDDTTARSSEQVAPNNNMDMKPYGIVSPTLNKDSLKAPGSAPMMFLPNSYMLKGDLFGAKNLGLYASSSRNTYINLLDTRSVEFFLNYQNNNLSLHTGVVANQYETLGVRTQFGISGALEYHFSPQWSVGVFGNIYNNTPYFSMAAFPFVETSSYGGWVKYDQGRIALKLGARNYYDGFQRRWRMEPIVTPSVKIGNKFFIELPVGPLLENLLKKSPHSAPTIMPDGR